MAATCATAQRIIHIATSATNVAIYSYRDVVEAAKNAEIGAVFHTMYYSNANDEGRALYVITEDTVAGYVTDSFAVRFISTGKYLKLLPSGGYVNGNAFGLAPDGVTDNKQKIELAIDYAKAIKSDVKFTGYGVNRFKINSKVDVTEDSITIVGVNNFKIIFNQRSHHAIEFNNCNYSTFSGVHFEGVRDTFVIGQLTCMFINNSKKFRVSDIHTTYAALFLGQNRTEDTINTVYIEKCLAKNFFTPSIPGSGYIITNCIFEQSDSTYLDRDFAGNYGSSHALYGFADRRNIVITHNMFTNIRLDGVKFSGGTGHVNNVVISHNTFSKCGTAVTIGADGAADHPHRGFIISHNIFRDCFGQRAGWTSTECTIRLYSCTDVSIKDNLFTYRSTNNTYWVYTIRGNSSGNREMGNLVIENNSFYGVDVDNNQSTLDVVGKQILLQNWNQYNGGILRIAGNKFENGFQLTLIDNVNVIIENNYLSSSAPLQLTGCAYVRVRNNTQSYHSSHSFDRSAIYINCSWVDEGDNIVNAKENKPSVWRQETNGVRGVKNPLTIKTGIAYPSMGKPMTGFFYGSGWSNNDSISIDGNVLRHGTHFIDAATLIAAINALPNYIAYDLSDSTGFVNYTNFIVIQKEVASVNPTNYVVLIYAAAFTAGISAFGGQVGSEPGYAKALKMFGGGGNKLVIFSPVANEQVSYLFTPLNDAAKTLGEPTRQLSTNPNSYIGIIEFSFLETPTGAERYLYHILN